MKVLTINGSKLIYNTFAFICILLIVYLGFLPKSGKMITTSNFNNPCYVCIIIDDFGNNSKGTKEFLYMDVDFTGAVLPEMPYTDEESRLLFENNKDVILHMPMEDHKSRKSWLGKGALLSSMKIEEIERKIDSNFSQINYAIGMNNHMGSKLTENREIVKKILEYCKKNNLIFVDSRTSNKSVVKEIAKELDIKYIERDVFLDGTKDISKIEKNIREAIKIANKKGFAVAIGHVGVEGGKVTAQAIKNVKENLNNENIKFVTLSKLIEILKDNT